MVRKTPGPAERPSKTMRATRHARQQTSKPPRFEDEVAVSEYVNAIVTDTLADVGRLPRPLLRAAELEADAIRLAERGNYVPLAGLLRESHPLNDPELNIHPWDRPDFHAYVPWFSVLPKGQIRSSLEPQTYELIADILVRKHKPKTNKKDRLPPAPAEDQTNKKDGRPAASAEDRRKMTPVHDAADLVPLIEAILNEAYPGRRSRDIRDRALMIAARRKNILLKTLRNYLQRPLTDRRRSLKK